MDEVKKPQSILQKRIKKVKEAKELATKVEEENKRLKWLIGTIRDVFDYNEYSKINLDLILECLKKAENCEIFDGETFQAIHMKILESGLSTLPTTDKAIRELGEQYNA